MDDFSAFRMRSPSPMPEFSNGEEDGDEKFDPDNDPVPYVAFSLEPLKLRNHLDTPVCNPSPDQIITQLALRSEKQSGNVELVNSNQNQLKFKSSEVNSKLKRTFRTIALRVLAHNAWHLSAFEKTVPLHLVNLLLNELILITDENLTIDLTDAVLKSLSVTAKIMYHYWALNVHLSSRKLTKPPAVPLNIQPNMLNDPRIQFSDQLNATLKMMADKSELNANQLDLFVGNPDYHYDRYFLHGCDSLHELTSHWRSELFSFARDHVIACVNFSIGKLKFLKLEMTQAKVRFETVCSLMSCYETDAVSEFFKIDVKELTGFCAALGIDISQIPSSITCSESIREKIMRLLNMNDYRAIVDILLEESCAKDIESKTRSLDWNSRCWVISQIPEKSQFRFQVECCNAAFAALSASKRIKTLNPAVGSFIASLSVRSASEIAFLMMVINNHMQKFWNQSENKFSKVEQRKMFSSFLCKILSYADSKISTKLLGDYQSPIKEILSAEEVKILVSSAKNVLASDVDDIESHLENPVKSSDSSLLIPGNLVIKRMIVLENEIIMESSIEKTRELLNEYITMPNARPIIVHFESWIPRIWLDRIKTVNTHDSYYRSFVPLALGKGFRFLALGEYRTSHDWFLNVAQLTNQVLAVLPGQSQPLSVAFEWEALNSRLNDLLYNDQKLGDDLVQKCLAILFNYLGNGTLFDIRSEIVETCTVSLLNSGYYKNLVDFTQFGLKIVRVVAILARFKQNMVLQGVPKFDGCKELFALTLELHTSNEDDSKKPRLIAAPDVSVEKPTSVRDNFLLFCLKLKDSFIIECLLTCLVRLYNVLNSENLVIELTTSLISEGGGAWRQLFIEHENLPNVSKTVGSIQRTIEQLLDHLLNRRSNGLSNVNWVKAYIELQVAKENYMSALKMALKHGSAVTNGFTLPNNSDIPVTSCNSWKRIWSDELLALMIRCCEKLCYNVLTAVFAQMMLNPQYSKVFSLLGSDAPRLTRDAGDHLYKFIFDKTILECIINAHTTRGELEKAEVAIEQMKSVDLNEYNSNLVKNSVAVTYSYRACQYLCKLFP